MGMESNQFGLSRHIPENVAREVRQRSRFGCVACGGIPYEYHHFDPPFANATDHVAKGITLLCPTHHAHVTTGLWSDDKIRTHNDNPFNTLQHPHFHLECRPPVFICLGSLLLYGGSPSIVIEGESVLSVMVDPMEGVLLSAKLYSEDEKLTVDIDRNHLRVIDPRWDMQLKGPILEIRDAPRKLVLGLECFPPHGVRVRALRMKHKGWVLDTSDDGFIRFVSPNGAEGGLYDGFWACTSLGFQGVNWTTTNNMVLIGAGSKDLSDLAKSGQYQQIIEKFLHVARYQTPPPGFGNTSHTNKGGSLQG
jgi:hypothetical protein